MTSNGVPSAVRLKLSLSMWMRTEGVLRMREGFWKKAATLA